MLNLNEEYKRKLHAQYIIILLWKDTYTVYMCSLVFWKSHINSVLLLVVGFGWKFTFFFVPFASFELDLFIMSMHHFHKNKII